MARTTTTTRTGVSATSIANIRKLFKEAKELFAPEGAFMGGIEAQLARTEKRAVASGMQGLAAAGLAGTSMAGGLGKKFQEEVAMPQLARAETTRLSSLAGLLQSQAGAETQLAPRFTTQTTYSPYGGTQRPRVPGGTTSFAAPRPVTQPAQQPRQQQPSKPKTERKQLDKGPTLSDPTGTFQATIGGISYYADGGGGFTTQGQATPSKQQPAKLASFYGGLTPSAYQPKDVYSAYKGSTPDPNSFQFRDVYRQYGK